MNISRDYINTVLWISVFTQTSVSFVASVWCGKRRVSGEVKSIYRMQPIGERHCIQCCFAANLASNNSLPVTNRPTGFIGQCTPKIIMVVDYVCETAFSSPRAPTSTSITGEQLSCIQWRRGAAAYIDRPIHATSAGLFMHRLDRNTSPWAHHGFAISQHISLLGWLATFYSAVVLAELT